MLDRSTQKPLLISTNKINPVGLKLEFKLDSGIARTEFTLTENHQGKSGYVHDGIIALLMDEGMGWVSRHSAGVKSVTAKLEIDFHHLAKTGETLIMTSQITKYTKRLIEVTVRIESKGGMPVATGHCLQYVMELNPGVSAQHS